tara:strand:+ start:120 stop:602 length:483 start_codon:yes stop_codon:yes gene_type:complete
MNLNPLDIIIFIILLLFTLSGLNGRFIKTIKTTINLVVSIILSNFILESTKNQFNLYFLENPILNLFSFLIIVIIVSLLIGFLLDFVIYQIEDPELDPNADRVLGALVGLVRGFVMIALMIFIFDTTPLTTEMKTKITRKVEIESFFFKPCNSLKDILLK